MNYILLEPCHFNMGFDVHVYSSVTFASYYIEPGFTVMTVIIIRA